MFSLSIVWLFLFRDETFIISGGELDSSALHSNVVVSPQISNTPLESKSEIYLPKKAHSQPGSLQGTPYASSESGSRPGSARKQWINEKVKITIATVTIVTVEIEHPFYTTFLLHYKISITYSHVGMGNSIAVRAIY